MLFSKAVQERKTTGTKMNKKSSRSHLILTLRIRGKKMGSNKIDDKFSTLTLVDLAGSERPEKSGVTGEQF